MYIQLYTIMYREYRVACIEEGGGERRGEEGRGGERRGDMAHLPFSEKYISQMRSLTLSCVSPRGVRGVGYSWLSARSRGRVECSFWLGGRGIRKYFLKIANP